MDPSCDRVLEILKAESNVETHQDPCDGSPGRRIDGRGFDVVQTRHGRLFGCFLSFFLSFSLSLSRLLVLFVTRTRVVSCFVLIFLRPPNGLKSSESRLAEFH